MHCKVDGCDRDAHYKAAQLCQKHYFRQWRYGTTDTIRRGKAKPRQETPQGYQWVYMPGHPLRHVSSNYVAEHRAVLHADLGDGPMACELCAKALTWKTCHVDHIDNNPRNNERSNLRPTCSVCNTRRGMREPAFWSRTISIEWGGKILTPHEWARDPRVNFSGAAVRRRIKSGMTPEEALFGRKLTHNGNVKVFKGPPKLHIPIEFAGLCMTAREWTRQPGVVVTDVTIRKRIKQGWPVGMALFNPPADTGLAGRAKLKELKARTA